MNDYLAWGYWSWSLLWPLSCFIIGGSTIYLAITATRNTKKIVAAIDRNTSLRNDINELRHGITDNHDFMKRAYWWVK